MRNATTDLKSAAHDGPAPLERRSFLGRFGGMLAGLLAAVPLIQSGVRAAGDVSTPSTPANAGRIRARIHPMAVARKTSRSLPNV
jgi:hypothetical protein